MAQRSGTIRAEIAGHGQYETAARDLDALIHIHWDTPVYKLSAEIKERLGDPGYDTSGLTKIEIIMILAELSGLATN